MQNPPKKLQSGDHLPPEDHDRLDVHRGEAAAAGRPHPGEDGQASQIDLRVSTIPTNHGESVVMRILDKSSLTLGLPQLGFLSDDQEIFERLITLPDGILLVTGPTGSGKTTTLYGVPELYQPAGQEDDHGGGPGGVPDERASTRCR